MFLLSCCFFCCCCSDEKTFGFWTILSLLLPMVGPCCCHGCLDALWRLCFWVFLLRMLWCDGGVRRWKCCDSPVAADSLVLDETAPALAFGSFNFAAVFCCSAAAAAAAMMRWWCSEVKVRWFSYVCCWFFGFGRNCPCFSFWQLQFCCCFLMLAAVFCCFMLLFLVFGFCCCGCF